MTDPTARYFRHLTKNEREIILALRAQGNTQQRIAEMLDCSQRTISVTLRKLATERATA